MFPLSGKMNMQKLQTQKRTKLTVGRRSRLTDRLIDQFAELLSEGISQRTAHEALGIPERTFYQWLSDGRAELEELPKKRWTLRGRLAEVVNQAVAIGEISLVQVIQGATSGDWKASAWLLERRWPERYARRSRIDVVLDWPQAKRVLDLVKDGLVTYDEVVESLGDADLALQLFEAAGIPVAVGGGKERDQGRQW